MRFFITLLLLLTSTYASADILKISDLRKIFVEKKLDKYVTLGQTVIKFLETEFKKVTVPSELDGGFSAEYFDLEYQARLRPADSEPGISLTELTADTNSLLRLHRKYYSQIKGKVFLRNYFQTAFLGLVHTIEAFKKVQVGLPRDGYTVLSTLILEHGRLITSNQKELVTMVDFWWDYIWGHFLNSPVDLIELGNQKLRGVWLNEKKDDFKKRLEKFLAGYSMLGLRKATAPIVYRDVTNQIYVRLAKNAYEIYNLRADLQALSKARVYKYKYETKSGLTEDAERTKREIAREGLGVRFMKIWPSSSDSLSEDQNSSLATNFLRLTRTFLFNVYYFIRYLVGFLLITFPFDAALIVTGLIILSVEGRAVFHDEFWPKLKLTAKKNSVRKIINSSVNFVNNFLARIINDLVFGFRMLFHYYTSDETNRNIRIGSSLLIFGLGLFFSSARTLVESFVAQLAL